MVRKIKQAPTFKGRRPKERMAIIVGENTFDGTTWQLWDRGLKDPAWISCKLIVARQRVRKANFWFGWHSREKRLSWVRDTLVLKESYPHVYAWCVSLLRKKRKAE